MKDWNPVFVPVAGLKVSFEGGQWKEYPVVVEMDCTN